MLIDFANHQKSVYCNHFSIINKKRIKFYVLCIIFAFFVLFGAMFSGAVAFASSEENVEQADELEMATKNTIDSLDLSELNELVCEIDIESLTGESISDVSSLISKMLSGEEILSFDKLIALLKQYILSSVKSIFIPLGLILFIVVVSNLIYSFKPNVLSSEIGSVVSYACLSLIIIILSVIIKNIIETSNSSVNTLSSLSSITFPILLILLSGAGAVTSSASFSPFAAIVSNVIIVIFKSVLIPIVLIIIVLNFVSKLTSNNRLDYLTNFFNMLFKWLMIVCLALITSFVAIKSSVTSIQDGFSIRAAKFAIKNYVPFLGGYLSDGFDAIRSGSVLVKNSVGVISIIFMVLIVIKPIVYLLVLSLLLKLIAGVTAMVDSSNISRMLHDLSGAVSKLLSAIIGIAFLIGVLFFIIICTGNNVVWLMKCSKNGLFFYVPQLFCFLF